MYEPDQEKTTFITNQGLYGYQVMPFGLKNVGAMYQRLVNKMFKGQIGRNVKVYVDDMLVKSLLTEQHLANLSETFQTLRKYKMKLNRGKCAFNMSTKKFFGFMVSQQEIEANPKKVRSIIEMQPPRNTKEV